VKRIGNVNYSSSYGANFYEKIKNEEREWIYQAYNQPTQHPMFQKSKKINLENLISRLKGKLKKQFFP